MIEEQRIKKSLVKAASKYQGFFPFFKIQQHCYNFEPQFQKAA